MERRDLLTGISVLPTDWPADSGSPATIVGGTVSAADAWPWAASLQENGHFCGASLIAPDVLVTAAHCVEGTAPQQLSVVLGKSDLAATGGKVHRVSEIIVHPNYDAYTNDSDIAILLLATPSSQKPLPMLHAEQADLAAPGTMAIIAGWGVLAEGSSHLPTQIHQVTVPIVSNVVANQRTSYDGEITDNMLAAGLAAGGKDSCQGDSGGPLMVSDASGQEYLAGIVSWGHGCARPNHYGIYTRVTEFANWVDERTRLSPAGSINLTQERYTAGQNAQVVLRDVDLTGAGSVSVSISAGNGDQEIVELQELLPGGLFSGRIALVDAAAAPSDGVLQVAGSTTIEVVYQDQDNGAGATVEVHDTARIIVDDIGNNASHSHPLVVPESIVGEIELSGDADWFRIDAQADTTYTMRVVLDGSLNDSVLTLYDRDGISEIDHDDDSGAGLASTLVWHVSEDGPLYIVVKGYGSDVGSYQLEVSQQLPTDDDHGSTISTATLAAVDQAIAGEIEVRFDRDWFAFTVKGGAVYELTTTLGTLNDSILRLLAPDGRTELAFNDDYGDGLGSQISWRAPAGGTYFVEVTGYDESIGDYQILISEFTIVGDDHGNAAESATPLQFPADAAGRIDQVDDVDWFAFDAVFGGQYVFSVELDDLIDSIMRIVDSRGNELAYNDDYNISLASRIAWTAPEAGSYYVEVSSYGEDALGGYHLMGTESVPVGDDDHGDSAADATRLDALPVRLLANIDRPHDLDYFSLPLTAGVVYCFETIPGSLNDSQIVLYAADGSTELTRDDDSGVGFGSWLQWQATVNDPIYLAVSGFGTETGSYELFVRIPYGDANLDGRFDSSDLVEVFQAGRYEAPAAENVTWAQGDWNGDGRFTTSDLIAAFQAGGYESAGDVPETV